MGELVERVRKSPVIPAIRKDEDLGAALASPAEVLFLLGGDISTIGSVINTVRGSGKMAFLHVDLVDGLGKDESAIRFVAGLGADGIVSTRSNLLNRAKREGMAAVLRLFMLDSGSLDTGARILSNTGCDAVEVMPGLVVPELMDRLPFLNRIPVIGGGLIMEEQHVRRVLNAGALGVSTGRSSLWEWKANAPTMA